MSRKKNKGRKNPSKRRHNEEAVTRWETHYVKKTKTGDILQHVGPPVEPTEMVKALMEKPKETVAKHPYYSQPIPKNVSDISNHPKWKGKNIVKMSKSELDDLVYHGEKAKNELLRREIDGVHSLGMHVRQQKLRRAGLTEQADNALRDHKRITKVQDSAIKDRHERRVFNWYDRDKTAIDKFFSKMRADDYVSARSEVDKIEHFAELVLKHPGIFSHPLMGLINDGMPTWKDYVKRTYQASCGGYANEGYQPEAEQPKVEGFAHGHRLITPSSKTHTPSDTPTTELVDSYSNIGHTPSNVVKTTIDNFIKIIPVNADAGWWLRNLPPDKWPPGLRDKHWPAEDSYVGAAVPSRYQRELRKMYALHASDVSENEASLVEIASLKEKLHRAEKAMGAFFCDLYRENEASLVEIASLKEKLHRAEMAMHSDLSTLYRENTVLHDNAVSLETKLKLAQDAVRRVRSDKNELEMILETTEVRSIPRDTKLLAAQYLQFMCQLENNPTKTFTNWVYGPQPTNRLKEYFDQQASIRYEAFKLRRIKDNVADREYISNIRKECLALYNIRNNVKKRLTTSVPLIINKRLQVGNIQDEVAIYAKWSIDYEQRRQFWFENQIHTRILPALRSHRIYRANKLKAEAHRKRMAEQARLAQPDLAYKITNGIRIVRNILNTEVYVTPKERKRREEKALRKLELRAKKKAAREKAKSAKLRREQAKQMFGYAH